MYSNRALLQRYLLEEKKQKTNIFVIILDFSYLLRIYSETLEFNAYSEIDSKSSETSNTLRIRKFILVFGSIRFRFGTH